MRWPWSTRGDDHAEAPVPTNQAYTPVADFLAFQASRLGDVTETTSLTNAALYRGVSLIAGTLAGLPFRSYTGDRGPGARTVESVFDDPDPNGQTAFEWKETAFTHLLLHGRCGAVKVLNGAGTVAALPLVHPSLWTVELPKRDESPAGGVWFRVSLLNGKSFRTDASGFWYVPALSLDGRNGVGILQLARESMRTTLAGDKASQKLFSRGATISGMATPEEEGSIDKDDLPEVKRQIRAATAGEDNTGGIAIINRVLRFTPWTMTAQQAQFIESRQFQIEEVSRWTGVPPHLLMQTEKQTSWGTGVDEQNRGLSRYVLNHWAQRFEQRASRLLANPRWTEFDFAGLERPNFAANVALILQQIEKGLISAKYGRALLNIPESAAPEPQSAPSPDPNGGPDVPPTE